MDEPGATWRKSSQSSNDDCVEVASDGDQATARDAKDRAGPVLVFASAGWDGFLNGVHEGEFDLGWRFVVIVIYAVAGGPVRDFLFTVLGACAEWIASRIHPG